MSENYKEGPIDFITGLITLGSRLKAGVRFVQQPLIFLVVINVGGLISSVRSPPPPPPHKENTK